MPTLSIPGGPRIAWGLAENSRARITIRLRLQGESIRFTLDLPRQCFAQGKELDAIKALGASLVRELNKFTRWLWRGEGEPCPATRWRHDRNRSR